MPPADDPENAGTTASEEPLAPTASAPSVTDCVLYTIILVAVTAVAVGAFVFLLDVIDQDTIGLTVEATAPASFEDLAEGNFGIGETTLADDHGVSILLVVGLLGIVGSTIVGALFGWVTTADDRTATLSAAGSAVAGATLLWVLVGFLLGLFTGLTTVMGDLVVNGVLVGIAAGVAAAGSAWTTRLLVPSAVSGSRIDDW